MCACYLIYYHDISPWDAIRIMRRQRPGSVERKVQEETVVTFGKLLSDYGKSTLEQLEQKEKELKELQKKQQEHSDNILMNISCKDVLNMKKMILQCRKILCKCEQ